MKLADLVSIFQWHNTVLFKLTGFGEAEYDTVDFADAFCEIEALQQENKQLQAQAARMREAVEVLETVTEHLENCYGRNTPDTEKAREVLAAIDKIGGKEDE